MKKLLFITVFILIVSGSLFAQDLNPKYYSSMSDGDYENDYSGIAVAIYMSSEEQKILESTTSSVGRDVNKMTKNNNWLCWKALNEWEIEDGETYMIICGANMAATDALLVIATIEDGGKSFAWTAKTLNTDDMDSL